MNVTDCLNKAGKAINKAEADMIKEKFQEFTAKGMDEAEASFAALKEAQAVVDKEISDVLDKVEKAGGKVNRPEVETKPMPVGEEVNGEIQIVDANVKIQQLDEAIEGIDDVLRCVMGAA
jgi:predicted lactoylglutathione lyase